MSAEEARFQVLESRHHLTGGHLPDNLLQEELQMALRVSSEEDVGGGAASDEGVHVVKPADKKKTGLGAVNEEGSIVLGDSDDEGNCLESGIRFLIFLFDVIILIRSCAVLKEISE